MSEEALQIDFRPQPRGIAVVTSAPISSIADSGNYAAFQDLIDGYASAFNRVHVFSPSGDPVVKPIKGHRVEWHSGPGWLSPTNGLLWSIARNRSTFGDIELVRTFGPRAGIVGKLLSKLSRAPHVSSSDDLIGNYWRDRTGWRSTPSKIVNKLGMLRADMLAATTDWELDYLSESGYKNDLLIGKSGLATDVYTPLSNTDPDRHPVVLWAGQFSDDASIEMIEKSALATAELIENVEFVVVSREDDTERLRSEISDRNLPVSVVAVDQAEPLVDLVERTWVCVTDSSRGMPHGLAMLAASAGVPLVSIGELDSTKGFKNQLNYVNVEPSDHQSIAYTLQLLRRWAAWSLRIGISGQRLVEQRYSTKTVAAREGEQLARVARGESPQTEEPVTARPMDSYVSPATGEPLPFVVDAGAPDLQESSDSEEPGESPAGFDLVAAALADLSGTSPTVADAAKSETVEVESEVVAPETDLNQDAITALFAAEESAESNSTSESAEMPAGDTMGQDAISALFAEDAGDSDDPQSEPSSGEMDQDAISALFAANEPESELPEQVSEPASTDSQLDQDAISALFASDDLDVEVESEPEPSNELDQDAISALFDSGQTGSTGFDDDRPSEVLGQDAISALFESNEPEPTQEVDVESILEQSSETDPPEPLDVLAESNLEDVLEEGLNQPVEAIEDEDFVSAIVEAKSNAEAVEDSESDELDADLPEVNLVKFTPEGAVSDEEVVVDEFDSEDVDPSLIEVILAGKDVDPAA